MFERSFYDIWLHAPFHPPAGVNEFVERFMVKGYFDAERFWQYVAQRIEALSRKKPARPRKKRARAASNVG